MMTTTQNESSTARIKREVAEIRKTAKTIASSKESARSFLISTGVYNKQGKLKAAFR